MAEDGIDVGTSQLDPTQRLLAQRRKEAKAPKPRAPAKETPIDTETDSLDATQLLLKEAREQRAAQEAEPVHDEPAPEPEEPEETAAPPARPDSPARRELAWSLHLHGAKERITAILGKRVTKTCSPRPKEWLGSTVPAYVNYTSVRGAGGLGDTFAVREEAQALDRAYVFLDRQRISPDWPSLRELCTAIAILWAYATPSALQVRMPAEARKAVRALGDDVPQDPPSPELIGALIGDVAKWTQAKLGALHGHLEPVTAALHPDPLARGGLDVSLSRGRLHVPLPDAVHAIHRLYVDADARRNDHPWTTLRDAIRMAADAWWEATHRDLLANYPAGFWEKLPPDVRDTLETYRPKSAGNPT